jgi:hypothetical protein
MKKNIVLLSAALMSLSLNLVAEVVTNKTFLRSPVIAGHRPLAEYGHQRGNLDGDDAQWGTSVCARAFFQQSTNSRALGKYFGMAEKNQIVISDVYPHDFLSSRLVHSPNLEANNPGTLDLAGTLSLRPQRSVWGVNIAIDQSLDRLVKGLYVSVNMPLAQVTHDLRASVSDETINAATGKGVLDYFQGNLSQPVGINQQAALTRAKFAGKQTKTAVAGLDFNLGYHLVSTDECGVRVRGLVHVPTGNKSTAEYLFEPIVGNNRHVELGLGVEMAAQVYKQDSFNLQLVSSAEMRYVVAATEKRMMGLIGDDSQLFNWSQYYLVGQSGQPGVMPAANVLPIDLRVSPGLKYLADLGLNAAWDMVKLGVGYSFAAHQAEKATLKGSWQDDLYALAAASYDASQDFSRRDNSGGPADTFPMSDSHFLTVENFDTHAAETPAQLSHKISVYGSFHPIKGSIDLGIGVFGGYQFVTHNADFAQYEVGGSIGMNF